MPVELIWYIRAIEVLGLALAAVLVTLAYGGYKKSGSRSMLFAALGFALLGAASLFEGLFFDVLSFSFAEAHAVRASVATIGLLILVYSVKRTN